jgi:hypothetical protein
MVEKEIDPEIFAAHFDGELATDESEADTELEEEFPKVCKKTGLEILFAGVL